MPEVTCTLNLGTARTLAALLSSMIGEIDGPNFIGLDRREATACKELGRLVSGPVSGKHALLGAIEELEDRGTIR